LQSNSISSLFISTLHPGRTTPGYPGVYEACPRDVADGDEAGIFEVDGGRAPQKDATNEDQQARRAIRYDAYENGVEGAEGSAASTRNLRAYVSITDEMVSAVVQALRQHGLAYYIAPLEADGQLGGVKSGRFAFLFLVPRPKSPNPDR
jgi:hypothetical protein